jgi:mannonate dehydratase
MTLAETDTAFAQPWLPREDVRITDIRAIVTAPEGIPLAVVRVDTDQPGLYGYGCATFTQRWKAVVAFLEHVRPLVVGRYPGDIDDLTRLVRFTGYWREGPVGNNALSGLDMALWDIAGKRAGMPVYEMFGGRVRAAADTYLHAEGADAEATTDHARELIAAGQRHVRIQVGQQGTGHYGAPPLPGEFAWAKHAAGWRVEDYLVATPRLFAHVREELGDGVELLHDVHSRLSPSQAITLSRSLEPYRPFFVEDVLAPEHWHRLGEVRQASPVPIAVGELATSFTDAARLVREHQVDYLRAHLSDVGGVSAARRLAVLADIEGVRTAWHSPGDASPFAVAAAVALDVTSPAFGIQEGHVYNEATHEVFPGMIDIVDGWLTPNDAPGWGIEVDEKAAARFPAGLSGHDAWAAKVRAPDGALIAP